MGKRNAVIFPRRGEVYRVSFDPTVGGEIRKARPALVIQNDVGNRYGPVTIVAAITSTVHLPLPPFKVLVESPEGGLVKNSAILLNQIRSVDRSRLNTKLGKLSRSTMLRVDQAIKISLGLIEI